MPTTPSTSVEFLHNLLTNLKTIQSYKSYPKIRRCAVSVILRFNFGLEPPIRDVGSMVDIPKDLPKLFSNNLNNGLKLRKKDYRVINLIEDATKHEAELEVLTMRRVTRGSDRWSGNAAFPGGKKDSVDLSDYDTAVRECFEEVGLNLKSSKQFVHLGELDDRYVTSRFGGKNLLVLSPQIFLQVSRASPKLNFSVDEVDQAGWVPLNYLKNTLPSTVPIQIGTALMNRTYSKNFINKSIESLMNFTFGSMTFKSIILPKPLYPTKLWGISLTILSDLMDMGHSAKQACYLNPLDHPLPKFDLIEVNYLLSALCPSDSLRKPITCRKSRVWEHYFTTLKFILTASILTRSFLGYIIYRYAKRFISNFKKT